MNVRLPVTRAGSFEPITHLSRGARKLAAQENPAEQIGIEHAIDV
jgi:hypothetical protein